VPDDRVTLVMPAIEVGQGVYTSNSMILAEELDVRLTARRDRLSHM